MPIPASVAQLTKTDRRKQWKALKTKHAKAISKAKLDFDLKLGPVLDKYQTQVEKLTLVAANAELTSVLVQPVLEQAWSLKKIVPVYLAQLKTLEEPAKKELAEVLNAINGDILSWEKLVVNTMGTIAKGTTDAQKAAASALINPLDSVRSMSLTLITRGPRAVASYQKPNPRPVAATLAGAMVETARLAGPAAHELAGIAQQVVKGTNYELFKARAAAAQVLVQNARNAAQAFKAKWVFGADDMTISSDTDAMALKGAYEQIVSDYDDVIKKIGSLP